MSSIVKAQVADFEIGGGTFSVLAGPCMAESRETCMEVAQFMKELCAKLQVNYVFKASFDKANRSSGRSVRGPGMEQGLGYLADVKKNLNLPEKPIRNWRKSRRKKKLRSYLIRLRIETRPFLLMIPCC